MENNQNSLTSLQEIVLDDMMVMEEGVQPGGVLCGLGCIAGGCYCGFGCPK